MVLRSDSVVLPIQGKAEGLIGEKRGIDDLETNLEIIRKWN